MRMVKEGYLGALSTLFERYQRPIYHFFLRMTGDVEQSMDLTQSTFQRVLKYRKTYRETLRFRPWLYRLARNHFYDVYRKQRRRLESESVMDLQSDVTLHQVEKPHDGLEERQKMELHDALNLLSREDRELILMNKFQGLKYGEISRVVGLSEGSLRIKMHRAMLKLKEIFYEERRTA